MKKILIVTLLIMISIICFSQEMVKTASVTKQNIEDRFYISTDNIDETITYIHKNLANEEFIKRDMGYSLDYRLSGILLEVVVSGKRPELKFISNYYGDSWLFHSYMKIKIGDIKKLTSQVEGTRNVLNGEDIFETNYYDSASDIQICKWMVENYTKEIFVRLCGKDYYQDINLSDRIKIAIKETYELYKLLQIQKDKR